MPRRSEIGIWIMVIVVAILAGLAIAGLPDFGSDDTRAVTAGPASTSTSAAVITTTSTVPATTTTAPEIPEPRPAVEVPILVANGTSVDGAASRMADQLGASGHPIVDAVSMRAVDRSQVWFTPGYDLEAVYLADGLGLPMDRVSPLTPDPPVEARDAALVVAIGPDLANP